MTQTEHTLTADLKPGTYFKEGRRWYRTAAAPHTVPSHTENAPTYSVPVNASNGQRVTMVLYRSTVEAAVEGAVPNAFSPATLRRRADKLRDQARALTLESDNLHHFALRLESERL